VSFESYIYKQTKLSLFPGYLSSQKKESGPSKISSRTYHFCWTLKMSHLLSLKLVF